MVSRATGLRVLIVDNDGDTADSNRMLVQLWGHQARTACSGAAALEVAAAFLPDVGLIDIGMPGMNGHQLCRQLRQRAGLERALLFAVTGYTDRDNRRRADDAGFALYLVKPIEPEWLRRLLDKANASRQFGLALTCTANTGATSDERSAPPIAKEYPLLPVLGSPIGQGIGG